MSISRFITRPIVRSISKSILGEDSLYANAPASTPVLYPLDASEAELQGIGYAGRLENPSFAQQQGGYTIPDGNGNPSAFYGMFPSLTGIVPLDLSSGDIAVEFDLSPGGSFTPDGAGSLLLANFKAWVVRLSDQQELLAVNMTRQQDSSATALFSVMGTTQGSSSLDPDENHRVGFLFENSTGKFRVWVNSTEVTLTDDTLPDLSAVVLGFLLTSSSADDNGAAGTTMTTRLITDPYWFTTPFPLGSVAIDGVTPVSTPSTSVATLLHMDGADGGTSFPDEAGRVWTTLSIAKTSTDQAKFGGASLKCATVDDGLTTPAAASLEFGDADFTLEAWVYMNAGYTSTTRMLMAQRNGAQDEETFTLALSAASMGAPRFIFTEDGDGTRYNAQGTPPTEGQWCHIAVCRFNDTITVYTDGVGGTPLDVTGLSLYPGTANFRIGTAVGYEPAFSGYIDEVRVLTGIAAYQGDFTPPAAPFTY